MDEKWEDLSSCQKLLDYLAEVREGKDRKDILEVGVGEMKMLRGGGTLMTRNLGSCVGIALYDSIVRVGCLIHIKFPGGDKFYDSGILSEVQMKRKSELTAYADSAIPIALYILQSMGCNITKLIVKIAGGSKMFPINNPMMDIGNENTKMVRKLFKRHDIEIIGEDTGNCIPRTMSLDVNNGEVKILHSNGNVKIL